MISATTLVLGARGKTGRRVVARLAEQGLGVRAGSRSGEPPFDWQNPATWREALRGVDAAYVTYSPDVASPEAAHAIESFCALAVHCGVRRLVMLSRRGVREAERCEAVIRRLPIEWTLLRTSWLAQCFSEDWLLKPLLRGEVVLPEGHVPEPFVDADDVADAAVATLVENGHAGRVYELTGPRCWSFREAVDEIARATRRRIRCTDVPLEEFASTLAGHLPPARAGLIAYLLGAAADGRNADVAAGITQVVGRMPRDFAEHVREIAVTGLWNIKLASGNGTRPLRSDRREIGE